MKHEGHKGKLWTDTSFDHFAASFISISNEVSLYFTFGLKCCDGMDLMQSDILWISSLGLTKSIVRRDKLLRVVLVIVNKSTSLELSCGVQLGCHDGCNDECHHRHHGVMPVTCHVSRVKSLSTSPSRPANNRSCHSHILNLIVFMDCVPSSHCQIAGDDRFSTFLVPHLLPSLHKVPKWEAERWWSANLSSWLNSDLY